ncbi:DNA polymerase III subunit epsilon [Mariprofundus erugo]|uniref:DNA polymerase III subunit epsilon n=1 Tax=Mariprofundus erugo TaxID=2528639 RepID=A0A5R9GYD2_9PROT|nr:DNA polymerase III subunit epsilon [Mariprofundus erugo]TLS68937.1 DNA polymerase III subunit epsilon [Mariprofundus erugo]TLS75231.1 DNA polymerase III subunit epsilon [Mariprofundus erugo]
MRLIMLDTETTGLSPLNGDRMVEIGAIEVLNRKVLSGDRHVFHHYINPERDIPAEVVRIHGIDNAKVKDAPKFRDIAQQFLDFIDGATLVIHNASFDLGFIMNELHLGGFADIRHMPVIDTLAFARKKHPHQKNNLDALCDRYNIERGHRELHGALLDSELLAEVYLAMTGGRQFSLGMDIPSLPASSFAQMPEQSRGRVEKAETATLMRRKSLSIPHEDAAAHQSMLDRIHKESGGQCIWKHAEAGASATCN